MAQGKLGEVEKGSEAEGGGLDRTWRTGRVFTENEGTGKGLGRSWGHWQGFRSHLQQPPVRLASGQRVLELQEPLVEQGPTRSLPLGAAPRERPRAGLGLSQLRPGMRRESGRTGGTGALGGGSGGNGRSGKRFRGTYGTGKGLRGNWEEVQGKIEELAGDSGGTGGCSGGIQRNWEGIRRELGD